MRALRPSARDQRRGQSPRPSSSELAEQQRHVRGKHEYTGYGIKALLDARAVDVMQADTYWAGGISEMQKIATVCSAYDIPLIPHGHSVPANIQLCVALPPSEVPYIEFLVKWNEILQHFYKNPVLPVDGYVTVPKGPGMGVELDPAKIDSEREFCVD